MTDLSDRKPTDPAQLFQSAVELHRHGRLEEAGAIYRDLYQRYPAQIFILRVLGPLECQRGDYAAGIRHLQRFIAADPTQPDVHANLANALREVKRFDEAIAHFDRALALQPDFAIARHNKGLALLELAQPELALQCFDQALALDPSYAEAHAHRGYALKLLQRLAEALASCERAIELAPDLVSGWNHRGIVLADLGRTQEALQAYEQAIRVQPGYAFAHHNRALLLQSQKRLDEAAQGFAQALALRADDEFWTGTLYLARLEICDWTDFDATVARMKADIERGARVCAPFASLFLADSERQQKIAAETWAVTKYPSPAPTMPIAGHAQHGRIRVGYFSADFENHATMHLMAEVFELHDRSRFELFGFSFGPSVDDPWRRRAVEAFEHFHDVRLQSETQIAQLARTLEIDIAIDLKGYTAGARPGIFAGRCAPIQVNYLGHPGTMGARFIDYLIADHRVIPAAARPHYSESIAYLPHSYQANCRSRVMADTAFSRHDLGLPETAFVFCCFNNNMKITPQVFELWLQILQRVKDSVLWLLGSNPISVANLSKAAETHGVQSNRLVFAPTRPVDEHFARLRHAELFLDTTPVGAHTTGSDALRMGVPLVTLLGTTFASRVGASLLHALALDELITQTESEYVELAVALATDAPRLRALRDRLRINVQTEALFDSARCTRHLEAAYAYMIERHRQGLPPETFDVRP